MMVIRADWESYLTNFVSFFVLLLGVFNLSVYGARFRFKNILDDGLRLYNWQRGNLRKSSVILSAQNSVREYSILEFLVSCSL